MVENKEYIVRDDSGNWMATYDFSLGADCFGWAKQCAKRSEGIVSLFDRDTEKIELAFNSKEKNTA